MDRVGKNQLVKLQKKFKTDNAVAKLYGMSRQAVHRLRNKYEIPTVDDKHIARNTEIVKSHQTGVSVLKLAKKFKLSVTQTYRIVKNVYPTEL